MDTLKLAYDCNVFYQSERCVIILHKVYLGTFYLTSLTLAIAIYLKKTSDIAHYVRWFIQIYQFRSDVFRLYYLALGTSQEALAQFRLSVDQRYLLRQIKSLDSALQGTPVVGSAIVQETTPEVPKAIVTKHNPHLLVLYGHRLASGGSYGPAQGTFPIKSC